MKNTYIQLQLTAMTGIHYHREIMQSVILHNLFKNDPETMVRVLTDMFETSDYEKYSKAEKELSNIIKEKFDVEYNGIVYIEDIINYMSDIKKGMENENTYDESVRYGKELFYIFYNKSLEYFRKEYDDAKKKRTIGVDNLLKNFKMFRVATDVDSFPNYSGVINKSIVMQEYADKITYQLLYPILPGKIDNNYAVDVYLGKILTMLKDIGRYQNTYTVYHIDAVSEKFKTYKELSSKTITKESTLKGYRKLDFGIDEEVNEDSFKLHDIIKQQDTYEYDEEVTFPLAKYLSDITDEMHNAYIRLDNMKEELVEKRSTLEDLDSGLLDEINKDEEELFSKYFKDEVSDSEFKNKVRKLIVKYSILGDGENALAKDIHKIVNEIFKDLLKIYEVRILLNSILKKDIFQDKVGYAESNVTGTPKEIDNENNKD